MILPPGASAWSFLASLPWPLAFATASVVGRGFRVAGGGDGASYKSEVILRPSHQTKAKGKLLLSIINTKKRLFSGMGGEEFGRNLKGSIFQENVPS